MESNQTNSHSAITMDTREVDSTSKENGLSSQNVKLEEEKPGFSTGIEVTYKVADTPPWYLSILLGFQHYLTMYLGGLSVPLIVSGAICMGEDNVPKSQLVSTMFFVCGISTLLQVIAGCRLPIVQISTFALLSPTLAYLKLPEYKCPVIVNSINESYNGSVVVGSPEHREEWAMRLNVVNGSIMVASVFEVLLGLTGAVGFLLRFIGPLTICPTISLLGVSLFRPAADLASQQWGIAAVVIVLLTTFSQYIYWLKIPFCGYNKKKGCFKTKYPLFLNFPVILAVGVSWLLCYILTVTDVFPNDPEEKGYWARTDTRSEVLSESPWFYVPYPGQWGMPTVSAALVCGLLAGLLASTVESVGDYYACARVGGAPPPPDHAINRGIMMEGIGCIIAGAFGAGNGTTSNSTNIGVVGLTKVGSRVIIIVCGIMLLILAAISKFGAFFTAIPDPIIGGSFMVLFGLIVAVGMSNLQYVNMNSSRNLFVFGFSFFFGLAVPEWIIANEGVINTGNDVADSIFTVLLSTNMFVGGVLGFILDNTIRGTKEERGITAMMQASKAPVDTNDAKHMRDWIKQVYHVPYVTDCMQKRCCTKYNPICPSPDKVSDHNDQLDEQVDVAKL